MLFQMYVRTYVRRYVRTYLRTYVGTYVRTYVRILILSLLPVSSLPEYLRDPDVGHGPFRCEM